MAPVLPPKLSCANEKIVLWLQVGLKCAENLSTTSCVFLFRDLNDDGLLCSHKMFGGGHLLLSGGLFSPAMQISSYYHYSFLQKLIDFAVNIKIFA